MAKRSFFIISFLMSSVMAPSRAFVTPSFFTRIGANRSLLSTARQCSVDDAPSTESNGTGSSSDGLSFAELRREVNRQQQRKQQAETARSAAATPAVEREGAFMEEQMMLRKTLRRAHVLIYNRGQDQEGVYTLYAEGRNVLRAWEDKSDAARYALMLRAEELPLGKPTELALPAIISFCKENGVGLEIVPRGRGLQPPSKNKPDFDWDGARHPEDARRTPPSGRRGEESLFTPQELARIKRQFERTLGATDDEE